MWCKSYSRIYNGVSKEQIWSLWVDVNNWHLWDPDIEYAKIETPFEVGSHFIFKPQRNKELKLKLVEVEKFHKYTDCYKFFGANLFGTHEMIETSEGLKLTTTINVTGILYLLWVKLVAQDIVDTLPLQMDNLVNLARKLNE